MYSKEGLVDGSKAYREGRKSTTTHEGMEFLVDDLLDFIKNKPTIEVHLEDLKWMTLDVIPDLKRVSGVIVDGFPIIVTHTKDNRLVTLDGFHRVYKALHRERRRVIEAKYISPKELLKIPHETTFKLYHVSSNLLDDLRPLALQSGGQAKLKQMTLQGYSNLEEYGKELNFFFNPILGEHVETLIRNGFERWISPKLYLYTINPKSEYFTKRYNYFKVASIPEQHEYDDLHWNKFMEENKEVYENELWEEWRVLKIKYLEERDKWLWSKYRIKTKMTKEELINHRQLERWKDFNRHFTRQLKDGNRKQYASYLPHVQISVEEPLWFDSVELIYDSRKPKYLKMLRNV